MTQLREYDLTPRLYSLDPTAESLDRHPQTPYWSTLAPAGHQRGIKPTIGLHFDQWQEH